MPQTSALQIISSLFGITFIVFGVNAILYPTHALTFFELSPPTATSDRRIVESLMAVYGIRDIFIGFSIHAAAFFGTRKSLGWILIAASAVAFADGAICWRLGAGEWNHWGYAPIISAVGTLLVGGSEKEEELCFYNRHLHGASWMKNAQRFLYRRKRFQVENEDDDSRCWNIG